jgi:hypothetical protein
MQASPTAPGNPSGSGGSVTDAYAPTSPNSLISEFAGKSVYNTPIKSPGGGHHQTWISPEPVLAETKTRVVNGTTFASVSDLSRPIVSRGLQLSQTADDSFDEELLCPVQLVPRVLCVGAACIDVCLCVGSFPEENQKIRTEESTLCGGGNAANTSGGCRGLVIVLVVVVVLVVVLIVVVVVVALLLLVVLVAEPVTPFCVWALLLHPMHVYFIAFFILINTLYYTYYFILIYTIHTNLY